MLIFIDKMLIFTYKLLSSVCKILVHVHKIPLVPTTCHIFFSQKAQLCPQKVNLSPQILICVHKILIHFRKQFHVQGSISMSVSNFFLCGLSVKLQFSSESVAVFFSLRTVFSLIVFMQDQPIQKSNNELNVDFYK